MFRFLPPEQMPLRRRKSHLRAYRAALDERTAILAGGTMRYHLQQKVGTSVIECVALTDGRVIPYSDEDNARLKVAEVWAETGDGEPPAIPK